MFTNKADALKKFEKHSEETLFPMLDPADQAFIRSIAVRYRLTFQELRQLAENALDLRMWKQTPLPELWILLEQKSRIKNIQRKKDVIGLLNYHLENLRRKPKSYPPKGLDKPKAPKLQFELEDSNKRILGKCPVASEETVCCNLHTIDAVENCGFGCSYCTIQTFYGEKITFDKNFHQKLLALELDPNRFYHIGTGQASDSLMWGNRYDILHDLCEFAENNPNILLEFKTKSRNVHFFLRHSVPRNIVCSWTLNTATIIENEEHFTASIEQRLQAARQVADRNIRVAFHFHPLVFYDKWRDDYQRLATKVLGRFSPDEVLFISFGSVTFIKPAIKAIRQRRGASKILQMELVRDPKGKLTYPDHIKEEMFSAMYQNFKPWHDRVFFYLCMEKAKLWNSTFGFSYPSNETFEREFGRATMGKLL